MHGRIGWQHLAFAVDSRAEVDRLHEIALGAGWTAVRAPKVYTRFNDRYYASFVEDDGGIRLEFMHNPPRENRDFRPCAPAPSLGAMYLLLVIVLALAIVALLVVWIVVDVVRTRRATQDDLERAGGAGRDATEYEASRRADGEAAWTRISGGI